MEERPNQAKQALAFDRPFFEAAPEFLLKFHDLSWKVGVSFSDATLVEMSRKNKNPEKTTGTSRSFYLKRRDNKRRRTAGFRRLPVRPSRSIDPRGGRVGHPNLGRGRDSAAPKSAGGARLSRARR